MLQEFERDLHSRPTESQQSLPVQGSVNEPVGTSLDSTCSLYDKAGEWLANCNQKDLLVGAAALTALGAIGVAVSMGGRVSRAAAHARARYYYY